MVATRRLLLLGTLGLAGCGASGPPRTFTPLRYEYLTRLRLNVASIDYAPLPPPSPLDAQSPAPPAQALWQLAQDRLYAAGSSGRAVVTVAQAQILRSGGGLDGTFDLRVDILAADGTEVGYAEARVVRRVEPVGDDLRAALYDMTEKMLDDMNVELEFQIRKSLRDYLQATETAPALAPVERQDLEAPAS